MLYCEATGEQQRAERSTWDKNPAPERRVWGPAPCPSKANEQARLVERRSHFISGAGNCWGRVESVQRLTPPPPLTSKRESLYRHGESRGPHAESAQSALTVSFRLVIAGLTSMILVVLATVNLQFPGALVSISLRPVLGIVAAHVLGTVRSFV